MGLPCVILEANSFRPCWVERMNWNYQLLSTPGSPLPPPLPAMPGVKEAWAVGSHQNCFFEGRGIFQWSVERENQIEGFEGNFHSWTRERKEGEKDKDPCVGTLYLWGNLLGVTTPSPHQPPTWHHTVEGLSYTKSQLPAQLRMPSISPGNRAAQISITAPRVREVGKTGQEVPMKGQ